MIRRNKVLAVLAGFAVGVLGLPAHADHEDRPGTGIALGRLQIVYSPATDDGQYGSEIRIHTTDEPSHVHDHSFDCQPTPQQQAAADELLEGTARVLAPYDDSPGQAFRDGFIPFPLTNLKIVHMFNNSRINDGRYLNPGTIESFVYATTDDGLKAVGGLYILGPEWDDKPLHELPDPTGCLLQWHNHQDEFGGAVPRWMAHVWLYGGLDPWDRHRSGSEAHTWFRGWRHIPAVCINDGRGCI